MTRNQAHDLLIVAADAAHAIESSKPQPADACDPACPGWGVFEVNRKPGREVERCDVCNRFADDDEALEHVVALLLTTIRRASEIDWTAPGSDL